MGKGQISVEQAAGLLQPGMTVFIHGTATEPRAFVEYLVAHPQHLEGVHLLTSFIPGINTVLPVGLADGAKLTSFMAQPALDDAIRAGTAEALRLQYSKIPAYLAALPALDLAFVHGRPLADGSVSTSISGELILSACDRATRVCVFENASLPQTPAGCTLPAERIDFRAESAGDPIEYLGGGKADATSVAIAEHVASLIGDGDALQTGIGAIPGAVFRALRDRRDLRIHSGMLGDSIMELAAAGALADGHEHVYGMALGSQALFAWLDQRDGFRVAGVEETHSIDRIARVEGLVAINSAVEVALDGSVNAEQIGTRTISGPGGLPDFALGAAQAPGGRSIIALPAANARKGISRIVPHLANHSDPTLVAGIVTHVVTEYGVASLANATPAECVERMLAIAAPEHRDALSASVSRH